jgi:Trypsin-like peptidase domain
MRTRAPLVGKAPAGHYRARTGDGKQAHPSHAIFPIVSQHTDGTFVPIGTGFFVAENGVFLTAAHVVNEVLAKDGTATGPFGLFQFLPSGQYHVRTIHRATRHLVADVAVGVATPMHHKTTGEPVPNKILTLAAQPPPLNAPVFTYAYPKSTVLAGRLQAVHFNPGYFEGSLMEHFPHGRDNVLLPGPCFRNSMVIHGGASGGPVIGPSGAVFAVNSTGLEGESVSFVSCVSAALDLAITEVRLPGDATPRTTTLRELIDRGFAFKQ